MSDTQKPRVWAIDMPFTKEDWPVVGRFGRTIEPVVIMKVATWKRLCAEHPTLGTAEFEIGETK